MALKAVLFDFGRVLSGPPDAVAYAEIHRLTGLTIDQVDELYWADRHAYDEGKYTGLALWEKFIRDANLEPNSALAAQLNELDGRMWTKTDEQVLAWHDELKEAGLRTAILSNMGDTVEAKIVRELDWVNRFDLCVWSHQLGFAKPDARIYTYTLALLGIEPSEALFIDDKQENIDAAHAVGMHALLYTTLQQLRKDLIEAGFDRELPLPAVVAQASV